MKRPFLFALGLGLGLALGLTLSALFSDLKSRPGRGLKELSETLAEAVREGRRAAREREAELRREFGLER